MVHLNPHQRRRLGGSLTDDGGSVGGWRRPHLLILAWKGAFTLSVLGKELHKFFGMIEPMEFYRAIFPLGELDEWREEPKERETHKYTGILVEVTNEKKSNGEQRIKRYTVTDELEAIYEAIWNYEKGSRSFYLMSPISYIGKTRKSENARIMYALVVELDNLVVGKDGTQQGLYNLINQWGDKVHWIPKPTYTVASGNGLHLYYVFEKGIPLFPNVIKSLAEYKRVLTRMIWNKSTTKDYEEEKIQYESIFQGFRVVGTTTKKGEAVQAFETGEKVTIEYMNSFIPTEYLKRNPGAQITQIYKSELTLEQAKNKYPDWYERRVERKEPKGHWICKRDLYDWWKRRIEQEAVVGHRYYCLMMLCVYAIKCNISQSELEKDCFYIAKIFESKTINEENHFTEKDILDALQSFEDKGLVTYPINSIINRSGLHIEKNKRNGAKQKDHLELIREIQKIKNRQQNKNWRDGNGRKPKQEIVQEWKIKNPNGKKSECIKETGLAKSTVYKWWEKT